MKYIVDRLREYNEPPFDYIAHEAAAKIEYLNRELDEACKEIFRIRRYRSEILEEAALNAEGFGGSANDAKNYWAREISESIRELKEKV